jgi:hypothetical protein
LFFTKYEVKKNSIPPTQVLDPLNKTLEESGKLKAENGTLKERERFVNKR